MLELPQIVSKEEEEAFFKNVAANVKAIRQERKMSQLEVALSIGQQAPGFYTCMENHSHKKHFNLSHLFKLSKLFKVPIEEFFKPFNAAQKQQL